MPCNVGVSSRGRGEWARTPALTEGPGAAPMGHPAFRVSRLRAALIKAICSGDERPCLTSQRWEQRQAAVRGTGCRGQVPALLSLPRLCSLSGEPRLQPHDSVPADISPSWTRGCNIYSKFLKGKDIHALCAYNISDLTSPFGTTLCPCRFMTGL